MMTKILTSFIKESKLEDNQELKRIVTFFAENLTLLTEKDYLCYHLIDEEINLSLVSNNFEKITKFYLHYDMIIVKFINLKNRIKKIEGKLYLPFVEEVAKLRIFIQSLGE